MTPQHEGDIKGKGPLFACHEPSTHVPVSLANVWYPPPPGWIKLNCDASFISHGTPSGAGAIATNHLGEVVLAVCSPMLGCSDAEDAEAKAALKGIMLLVGVGHDKIILELDCARAVMALRSPRTDRSLQWATYDKTKSLSKTFADFKVVSVKRESNRVADCLAKLARSAGSCIWFSNFLDVVYDLVTQDKNCDIMK
ncbi:hypothetical protein ACQ4PT_048696 [Festuca glaucescens]